MMKYTILGILLLFSLRIWGQKPMSSWIEVPANRKDWDGFRKELCVWKEKARKQLRYDDTLYCSPEFAWSSRALTCCFLMLYDASFYDPKTQQYTVEEFIDRGEREFGGYDVVVLWHAYPRIGLDQRNQFDFYREMPGGLEGLREVTKVLHQRGKKVFINYNPWDVGTDREGKKDVEALAELVQILEIDGIFLDTMEEAMKFRAVLDNVRKGVVLESEMALPLEGIATHHMSWAQWFITSDAPGILRNKWFEQRHILHQISRWHSDKSRELLTAWFNGSGVMIWENVFGQQVGWSERDKSVMRLMTHIRKEFADWFSRGHWDLLVKEVIQPGVYANCWTWDGVKLWTFVNWSKDTVRGDLLSIPADEKKHYFDLIRGTKIIGRQSNGNIVLAGEIGSYDIGCLAEFPESNLNENLCSFLLEQARLYADACWDTKVVVPELLMKPVFPSLKYPKAPDRMCLIPAMKGELEMEFRVREIGFNDSFHTMFKDAVYPALHGRTTIKSKVSLNAFAIDETPVTNREFMEFLRVSGYAPVCRVNFLKHWVNGEIPLGMEDYPVVYIDLNDARAYARWAGKRLPTIGEWQYAAQGKQGNLYPWGNELKQGCYNPALNGEITPVKAFPQGKSDFGCYDMCGNVWELTESECENGWSRFCMLKGGSCYKAVGSDWYFDGGPQKNSFVAKQMLIYPGLDRCATIGFRCVVDIE